MNTTEKLAEALRKLLAKNERFSGGTWDTARAALAAWDAERAAPAEPVGWTDADADAARLALELECLLTDRDVPMPAVSRWWESAHEALMLHRQRIDAERQQEQEGGNAPR